MITFLLQTCNFFILLTLKNKRKMFYSIWTPQTSKRIDDIGYCTFEKIKRRSLFFNRIFVILMFNLRLMFLFYEQNAILWSKPFFLTIVFIWHKSSKSEFFPNFENLLRILNSKIVFGLVHVFWKYSKVFFWADL